MEKLTLTKALLAENVRNS